MTISYLSLVATQFTADYPNSDRMFDKAEWAQFNAKYRFTIDGCADSKGLNAFCNTFCSPINSFLETDVSGHTVWLNPPFDKVRDFLQHYLLCKATKPCSTSACIVLPDWQFDATVNSWLSNMQAIKRYSRGTKLFSAPDPTKPGGRKRLPGIPWSVTVYYDPPKPKHVPPADNMQTDVFASAKPVAEIPTAGTTDASVATVQKPTSSSCSDKHPTIHTDDHMVVKGKLNGHRCRILLDTGADGNFISAKFVDTWHLVTSKIHGVSVQGGFSKSKANLATTADLKLGRSQALQFTGQELVVCPLQIPGVDIVLGVPWFEAYDCVIRPKMRTCTVLQPPNGGVAVDVPAVIPQIKMLSALQFKRASRDCKHVFALTVERVETAAPSTACSPELTQDVRLLVQEYADVFPDDIPDGVPTHRSITHTIPLVAGAKPVAIPMYRLSQIELEEVHKQVTYLLEKGLIAPTTSPWAAPVLFAPKADGGLRMCIDYRALNKQTVKDRFPLPRTEELLDRVGSAKFFSKLDLRSGYWQIPVTPADQPKTAFRTRYGHYEWKVMPFGLTNAPACFQRLVNSLFSRYLDKFIVVYLDDILIFSNTAEEHLEHLRLVLEVLRQERLYAKLSKCQFFQTEVDFLGHKVSNGHIKVDPVKVAAVAEWPRPTSVAELRSFLGMVNYFRRFIENHARICKPLYELLNNKSTREWTVECENSFVQLKQILTSHPVLTAPDYSKPFILYTDASVYGIGAVLMQQHPDGLKPVAYESRKFIPAEVNYPTHEQELLAVVHSLKTWHCYLEGSPFTVIVRSDHKPLQHFLTQPHLSRRQARWWEVVHSYDFEVHYCKGTENIADALSRRPDHSIMAVPQQLAVITKSKGTTYFPSKFLQQCRKGYKKDPWFTDKNIYRTKLNYKNQVYYTENDQLVIPHDTQLKHSILHDAHDSPTAGHCGVNLTLELVRRDYWWPGIARDVHSYVRECIHCQRNKALNRKPAGLLQPIPIPTEKFASVSLDLITDLPVTARGFDSIVTMVDRLTRYVIVQPTVKTCTAADIAQIFVKHVTCKGHGVPVHMLTDRDPRFMSHFWQALLRNVQTKHTPSTAFHPQTDGLTERYNRVVEDMLRNYVAADQKDWDEYLHFVEFAINNSVNGSTGYSPYYLHNGYHPRMPMSWHRPVPSSVPSVADMIAKQKEIVQQATKNLQAAQERQKKYYDKHHVPLKLDVGSYVLLNTRNLQFKGGVRKLHPRWCGPFKVKRSIRDVAYELHFPAEMGSVHPVFHASLLKPFVSSERQQISPPPVLVDGEEEYEVEAIIGHRYNRNKLEYLVRWVGYDAQFDEYLPLQNLTNCAEMVADYNRTHNVARQTTHVRTGRQSKRTRRTAILLLDP